eukprot:8351539-Alexandrium_andersonii.AAC.1
MVPHWGNRSLSVRQLRLPPLGGWGYVLSAWCAPPFNYVASQRTLSGGCGPSACIVQLHLPPRRLAVVAVCALRMGSVSAVPACVCSA